MSNKNASLYDTPTADAQLKSKFIVQEKATQQQPTKLNSFAETSFIEQPSWKHDMDRKTRIETLAEKQVQNMARKIQSNTRQPAQTVWGSMIEKEEKKNLKYHAHDKTLMILLDEEKAKYADLEGEYNKLLREVQALHTAHKRELEQQERRFATENKSLQKALMLKSEEYNAIQGTLKNQVEKGIREGTSLKTEKEELDIKYRKARMDAENLAEKVRLQEKVLTDLATKRKQLEKDLEIKSQQLSSLMQERNEKEKNHEKVYASRNMLENQVRVLEKQLADKEDECLALKTKLLSAQNDHEKLESVKRSLMEMKVDHEQSKRREKQYLEELEQAGARERQLLSDNDALSTQVRRFTQLQERFQQKEQAYVQEIDGLKATQYKLKQELHDTLNKKAQISEELAQTSRELKKYVSKMTLMQQELAETKDALEKMDRDRHAQEEKMRYMTESETLLKRENEKFIKENDYVRSEVKSKESQLEALRAVVDDLRGKLDAELEAKREMKAQMRDQFNADQDKISHLQKLLKEATFKIEELNQSEDALKQSMQSKEAKIEEFQRELAQLQNNLLVLQSKLTKQRAEFEVSIKQKEDQLTTFQYTHETEVSKWESEAERLSTQLSQKNKQADVLTVQATELSAQLEDAKEKIMELRSKLNDVQASRTALSQHLEDKNIAIDAKDQEIDILQMKNRSLNEQVRRLEEEVASHRSTSVKKDTDLARLQSNVNDLSKRLKSQVDMILERDLEYAASTISNRGTPSPTRNAFRREASQVYAPMSFKRDFSMNSFTEKQITGFDDLI